MNAGVLAADLDLQQALLDLARHTYDDTLDEVVAKADAPTADASLQKTNLSNPLVPTRWTLPVPAHLIAQSARTVTALSFPKKTVIVPHSDTGRNGAV